MRKTLETSLISLVFLILSSIIGYFLRYVDFAQSWLPLVIAAPILVIDGVLAFFAKKQYKLNYVAFFFNSVALGFCIRAWYIFRGFDNNIWIMLGVSAIASLYIWVYYLYSYVPGFEEHPKIFTLIFILLTLGGYIALVILTKTTFVSTLGYYLIIEVGFLFASSIAIKDNKQLFRNVVLSTFSVVIVAIIVAIMIAGGDGLDIDVVGLDLPIESPRKKKGPTI